MSDTQRTASPQPTIQRGAGKLRRIRVIAESQLGSGDGIAFHMEQDGKRKDRLTFSKSDEGMKKADWHEIVFELHDPTGSDLRFHPDPGTAMWVARGTKDKEPRCPRNPAKDPVQELRPIEVSQDGLQLTVINDNKAECYLSFQLNFVEPFAKGDTPKIVAEFDPVIQNKNGGEV
jgi:hypothetical protein